MEDQPLKRKEADRLKRIGMLIDDLKPVMPTYQQIADTIGVKSPASAKYNIDKLIKLGYLERYGERRELVGLRVVTERKIK